MVKGKDGTEQKAEVAHIFRYLFLTILVYSNNNDLSNVDHTPALLLPLCCR